MFGTPKMAKHWVILAILAILGVPKKALWVPESKFWDHFYRPNTPLKPPRRHLRNPNQTLKVIFSHFIDFVHFPIEFFRKLIQIGRSDRPKVSDLITVSNHPQSLVLLRECTMGLSPCKMGNREFEIWIKIEWKLGFYFSKLGNPLFQWIAP